jgi:lysophospholipase L1-like esterase
MEVINAGVSGHNTRDILARLDKDCLALRPGLVVLKIGTNDALNSFNLVSPEESRQNLRTLADKILASGARLLLCTMLTYNEVYLLERHGVAGAYGEIPPAQRFALGLAAQRELAQELQLPLVDLNVLFTALGEPKEGADSLIRNEANCGVRDGVHPTATGYRVLAAAVWQAIVAHRLPTDKIVCIGDSITYGEYMALTPGGEPYPALLAKLLKN